MSDVFSLKSQILGFDGDGLIALNQALKQIGRHLSRLQVYENKTGSLVNQKVEMLPSYVQFTSEGFKVFDELNVLRCILGQYASGEYGLKVINGELYATSFQSGAEGATSYIKIDAGFNPLSVVASAINAINIYADTKGGYIEFRDTTLDETRGWINVQNDANGKQLVIYAEENLILSAGTGAIHPIGDITLVDGPIASAVKPDITAARSLGSSSCKWYTLYSSTLNTGDLGFTETECGICGERFNDGDILCLMVKTIDEENYSMTIPVHEKCKDVAKTITVEMPARTTKYRLNKDGVVESYLEIDYEETEEEVHSIRPNCSLDRDTGKFVRKGTKVKDDGDILIGSFVKQSEAVETKTVKTKKPKVKEITITLNAPKGAEVVG